MPKRITPLSPSRGKNAKAGDKPAKLRDGALTPHGGASRLTR